MTAAILIFGGLGAALAALAGLLVRPRPGLLATIGRLDAARTVDVAVPRSATAPTPTGRRRTLDDAVAQLARRVRVAHRSTQRLARDLAATERSIETLAARRVLTAVAGFCALPALALALAPGELRLPTVALPATARGAALATSASESVSQNSASCPGAWLWSATTVPASATPLPPELRPCVAVAH